MKIRFLIVVLAMLFVVPFFSACKNDASYEVEYNFSINSTEAVLEVGNTFNVVAVYGESEVNFFSENSSVATVSDDGLITAVATGETTIRISAEGTDEILYCKISVVSYEYTIEFVIENNYPVYINTERMLEVKTLKDGVEYDGKVVWSVDGQNATVTANGRKAVFKANTVGEYIVRVVGEKGEEKTFIVKVVDSFN